MREGTAGGDDDLIHRQSAVIDLSHKLHRAAHVAERTERRIVGTERDDVGALAFLLQPFRKRIEGSVRPCFILPIGIGMQVRAEQMIEKNVPRSAIEV